MSVTVQIGMKREQWVKTLQEALDKANEDDPSTFGGGFKFTIYGVSNASPEDVTIEFDNEDMEHNDNADDACFVEVSRD